MPHRTPLISTIVVALVLAFILGAVALTISASLAQIGEFSFILAGLGVSLSLLPERGQDLILAGAIISILLNPVLFAAVDRYSAKVKAAEPAPGPMQPEGASEPTTRGHVVLVGHGRVGRVVSSALKAEQIPLLLIEEARPVAAAGCELVQ